MSRLDRRSFLATFAKALVCGLSTPYLVRFAAGSAAAQGLPSAGSFVLDQGHVFDLSVASGDPSETGVMLWTRVRPEAQLAGQPLRFQLASDMQFSRVLLEGELAADSFGPHSDHTVRVDLDGQLAPGTQYHYRFLYAGTASRTGRCRTLPAKGARKLKLAVLTCQDYTNGYYGALRHVADDSSIDFVLHLGDFIYEAAGDPRYQSLPFADRTIVLPSGGSVALGISDYRHIYRSYRSDPMLQRALEQHTWIIGHDDHEIANDCYWDYERDTLGAPDHPFVEDAVALRTLKLDAQRAWYEYVPARVPWSAAARHPHERLRTYRSFVFGDLAALSMLDTRSYRSPHPCGEGDLFERYLPVGCRNYQNPSQTMLGASQRSWLSEQLGSRAALWNVLGNQTFFARLSLAGALPINVDAWDGYEAERRWLSEQVRAQRTENLVVLTGDLHAYIASQVKLDYRDLNPFNTANQIGVEFMTPSVTSAALFDQLRKDVAGDRRLASALTATAVRVNNPHIRYFDSTQHGYSTVTFTREYCEWTAYSVDKNAAPETAGQRAIARFRKYVHFPQLVALG